MTVLIYVLRTYGIGFAKGQIDTVLGYSYGPPDTRSFGGLFPGFPIEKGKFYGLTSYWISNLGIDKKQVDIVLGENENGLASSFIKKYNNGGALVQIWMSAELPVNMDAIIKLSEWKL